MTGSATFEERRLGHADLVTRRKGIVLAMAAGLFAAAPEAAAPRIAGMSAYLLDSKTGKLSADLVRTPELLGNAVTTGRSALVVIRIAYGKTDALPSGQSVRLVATEGASAAGAARPGGRTRILIDRATRLGPVGEDGSTHAGFWLDNVGCAPIMLDASLPSGAKTLSSRHFELGFQCYE